MKKRKKIFYVGGLFSLLVIPLYFCFLAKNEITEINKYRFLDIGLLHKLKKGENPDIITNIIPTKNWKYQIVNVPVNFTKQTEYQYFNLIKKLQKDNIDKTGIRFQLSENNSYKDVVGLLNLMEKTEQKTYGFDTGDTNSFYVSNYFHKDEDEDENDFIFCVIDIYEHKPTTWEKSQNFLEVLMDYPRNLIFPIVFGYLLLVYCAILKPKIYFKI